MKDGAMASAVDGLKQRFMDMSQPDDAGIYRNGSAKRKARTELAMQCLTELWQEACKGVSFRVPDSGIGFAAVGSLARGRRSLIMTCPPPWGGLMSNLSSEMRN